MKFKNFVQVVKKQQTQTSKIPNVIVQHREVTVNLTNAPSTSSSSKTRFFVLLKFSNWNILQTYNTDWSKIFRSSPTYSKGGKVLEIHENKVPVLTDLTVWIVSLWSVLGFVHNNLTWRNLMEGSPFGPRVKYGNSSGRGN